MSDPAPKHKSTGWRSQNRHYWGHCHCMADQVTLTLGYRVTKGEVAAVVRDEMRKVDAWPRRPVLGRMVDMDWSEVDSATANAAIEMCHALAEQNNLYLVEYDEETGLQVKMKGGRPWEPSDES